MSAKTEVSSAMSVPAGSSRTCKPRKI